MNLFQEINSNIVLEAVNAKDLVKKWNQLGAPRDMDGMIKVFRAMNMKDDHIASAFKGSSIKLSDNDVKRNKLQLKQTLLQKGKGAVQGVKDKYSELAFDLDDDQNLYNFGKSIGTSALKLFLQRLQDQIKNSQKEPEQAPA